MAITKTIVEDKIEVVGDFKGLNIRTATVIKEDGVELTRTFHRKAFACGTIDASNNWIDTDISAESAEVKGIANTVWTQAVKDAYKAHLIAGKS